MSHTAKHKEEQRIFGLSFLPEQIAVPRPGGFLGRLLEGIIDPQERIGIPGVDSDIEFSPGLAATGLALATLGSSAAAAGGTLGIGALASRIPGLATAGRVAGSATGIAPFSPRRLIGRTAATAAVGGGLGLAGGLFGGGGDVTEPALAGDTAVTDAVAAGEPTGDQSAEDIIAQALQSALAGGLEAEDTGRPAISEIRLQTLELPDGTQLFIPVGIAIGPDGAEQIIDIGGTPLTQEELQSRLATQEAQQELARAQAFSQIAQNIPALTQFLASPEGRLLLESQPEGGGIQSIIAQAIGGQGFGGINIPGATGRVTQEALGGASPLFNAPPAFTPLLEEEAFGVSPPQGIPSGQLERTVTPSPRVVQGLSESDRNLLFTALGITGEAPADLATAQSRLQRRR